jgi:hypothetical protein
VSDSRPSDAPPLSSSSDTVALTFCSSSDWSASGLSLHYRACGCQADSSIDELRLSQLLCRLNPYQRRVLPIRLVDILRMVYLRQLEERFLIALPSRGMVMKSMPASTRIQVHNNDSVRSILRRIGNKSHASSATS